MERQAGSDAQVVSHAQAATTQAERHAPGDVAPLLDKEKAAQTGHGPELTKEQQAHLKAWQDFPDAKDQRFRDLDERSRLIAAHHGKGGEQPLTKQESAELGARREFPNKEDEGYRALAERDRLGPPLSDAEKARLAGKRQFPNPADDEYRQLAEKRNLEEAGLAHMTPQERVHLASKQHYPKDEQARKLWEKDILHKEKLGPPLTPMEESTVQLAKHEQARKDSQKEFPKPEDEEYRKLAEKRNLHQKNEGPALTAQEQAHLQSKERFPAPIDEPYRKLAEKQQLHDSQHGPALTAEEVGALSRRGQ